MNFYYNYNKKRGFSQVRPVWEHWRYSWPRPIWSRSWAETWSIGRRRTKRECYWRRRLCLCVEWVRKDSSSKTTRQNLSLLPDCSLCSSSSRSGLVDRCRSCWSLMNLIIQSFNFLIRGQGILMDSINNIIQSTFKLIQIPQKYQNPNIIYIEFIRLCWLLIPGLLFLKDLELLTSSLDCCLDCLECLCFE